MLTTIHASRPSRLLVAALAAMSLSGTTTAALLAADVANAQPCPSCHDPKKPPPTDGGTL
jgi:disulfide bond formation protein DsbB